MLELSAPFRNKRRHGLNSKMSDKTKDIHQWLEAIADDKALAWVDKQNHKSLLELTGDSRFEPIRSSIQRLLTTNERIPFGDYDGRYIYNFWQSVEHVRGIIRRVPLSSYRQVNPEWETVLDIDELAAVEKENWVYKGMQVLPATLDRALISLSRGGQDASVVREFDFETKSFVDDGFVVAEAKTVVSWMDRDTLLIGTDFGTGSMTKSGYPRVIKRWHRGTQIEAAEHVFTGEDEDIRVSVFVSIRDGRRDVFVHQNVGFFEPVLHRLTPRGDLNRISLPLGIQVNSVFKGQLVFTLKEPWTVREKQYYSGSVVSIDLEHFDNTGQLTVEILIEPKPGVTIGTVAASLDKVYVVVSEDVVDQVQIFAHGPDGWSGQRLALPDSGSLDLVSVSGHHNTVLIAHSSYLEPHALYEVNNGVVVKEPLKSLVPQFDASSLVTEQHFAESKDGTKVPYFLVRPRELPFDGTTPTLQYGYGGFEISQKPKYIEPSFIPWVEQGRCFVVANIRGGGEYGPAWHQSALKLNRQRSFDDFIAVSEDLIRRKVTSPECLGIQGGSNGGLLMGVMLTQRPDLYGAVVCQVPLLDMLRFHKLLAGASWIAEYGSPDVDDERDFLRSYSPYHSLREYKEYPPTLITTSTKDDRVHPGHARKMVARMIEQGHDVSYFENVEGGHGGAANQKQRAMMAALSLVFLLRRLAA